MPLNMVNSILDLKCLKISNINYTNVPLTRFCIRTNTAHPNSSMVEHFRQRERSRFESWFGYCVLFRYAQTRNLFKQCFYSILCYREMKHFDRQTV